MDNLFDDNVEVLDMGLDLVLDIPQFGRLKSYFNKYFKYLL